MAQRLDRGPRENGNFMPNEINPDGLVVVSYHVVERINMPFGGRVTVYDVSDKRFISTNDLGANNSRTITPKYGKAKIKVETVALFTAQPKKMPELHAPQMKLAVTGATESLKSVNIDILKTYERVLDKGYQSIDMLKRVANGRYFDGDLVVAAKYYEQLFALTDDLEPVMYFRYAQSLSAINKPAKAREMMAVFERKDK